MDNELLELFNDLKEKYEDLTLLSYYDGKSFKYVFIANNKPVRILDGDYSTIYEE